jgi:linoleoyl-CoA desaturase
VGLPVGSERVAEGWAAHQVHTTMNFARRNRLLTWYLGGLNFQVEHHLFPKTCHIHYPAISPIVEATCRAHGISHRSHRTMRGAFRSHVRWLKRMGCKVDKGNKIDIAAKLEAEARAGLQPA